MFMVKMENFISIYDLCKDELSDKDLQVSYEQDLLLTAVASYLYYECLESDRTLKGVCKILKCLNVDVSEEGDVSPEIADCFTTFDVLFEMLREHTPIHPAVVCYDVIAHMPRDKQISLKDSCLKLLDVQSFICCFINI